MEWNKSTCGWGNLYSSGETTMEVHCPNDGNVMVRDIREEYGPFTSIRKAKEFVEGVCSGEILVDERLYFSYDRVKGERLAITGLHGWINPKAWDFTFCARCHHMDYLKIDRTLHGDRNRLNGLRGDYFEELRGNMDLDKVYSWAANQGWYQFINPHNTKDMVFSKVPEIHHKRCRSFASDWQHNALFNETPYA